MADAIPTFAFSRRDPSAVLRLAQQRSRLGKGVRVLALGGQPRDRVYCAQLLAESLGQPFVQLDIGLSAVATSDEKATLERLLAFARSAHATLCLNGAEALFQQRPGAPGERAAQLGAYLRRVLAGLTGTVVFGMPEKTAPDLARLPPIDLQVTFRAPSGAVVAGRPLLLPSHVVDEALLPGHNFQVDIDDIDVGLCAVSAPSLVAGAYSEFDFDPRQGAQGFVQLPAEQRAAWPTITLRRALTQSTLFFDWKQGQATGKPLLRRLVIRQLDWQVRRIVNTWQVDGCWARRWTGPAFDAQTSTVAQEQLEVYYQSITWERER